MLRKAPAFAATAILALGLGIGANTAMFTIVDRLLLRDAPYPDPGRLAVVVRHFDTGEDATGQTGRIWTALHGLARTIDVAATGGITGVNLSAGDRPRYVQQQRVSAGFFRVLGASPALGREFTDDDDRANGVPAVILSDAVWRRILNADPAAIGRTVMLRGESYTVVGVMPAAFRGDWLGTDLEGIKDRPVDVWTPLRPSADGEGAGENYELIARLRPGVTWPEADAEVMSLGAGSLLRQTPSGDVRLRLVPMLRGLTEGLRQPLMALWSVFGVLLLIGCVNLAGLQLARASARAPEIAARLAVGASRGDIVRQLMAESLALAVAGGAAGVALGEAAPRVSAPFLRSVFGAGQSMHLDSRVFAAACAITVATALLFGLLPAMMASRVDLKQMLVESGSSSVAGAANGWPRRVLAAAQMALAVVLLVGAGLLVRTFLALTALPPGFDDRNVVTATLSLQDSRYATAAAVTALFERTIDRIRALPGVEDAAVCLTLPYERALNIGGAFADGARERIPLMNLTYVTPGYFPVLGIAPDEGRLLAASDDAAAAPVMVVNRAFVRRYLHGRPALGRHIAVGDVRRDIVGVVPDVLQDARGWGPGNGRIAATPAGYVTVAQFGESLAMVHGWFSPSWIVRTSGPIAGIASQMQRAVETVDSTLPFNEFRTLDDVRRMALMRERTDAWLVAAMALLAVLLAGVGLYGLSASSLAERTRELGIRIALGATPARAVWSAALPGVVSGAAGVLFGLAASRAAAGVMRSLIWGVPVDDDVTFGSVAALMLTMAVVAALVPALRVRRLNVIKALRRA